MYIKLNFTADTYLSECFRIVNEMINNVNITSVSTLQTVASANAWINQAITNLDANNSEIVRTSNLLPTQLTLANTRSNIAKSTSGTTRDDIEWTVEFSRYDDTTKKYYVQHRNPTSIGSSVTGARIFDGITNNANNISALSQTPATTSLATASSSGTLVTPNASLYTVHPTAGSSGSGTGFTNVRCFWMYISDTAMVYATTNSTSSGLGFQNNYGNSAYYCGPFIYSQYTRFDYHNNNTNGITPLFFTNGGLVAWQGVGCGFGVSDSAYASVENTQFTTGSPAYGTTFRIFNLINAFPSTNFSWPVIPQPQVSMGVGSRYNDIGALSLTTNGGSSSASGITHGAAFFTATGTRFPGPFLTTQNYAMLPVSWRQSFYYNSGGDASGRAGWYLFNGEYYPGDEYSYGGKTYKILPGWAGYSARAGIAIPKE
jgi:hypothetical protein